MAEPDGPELTRVQRGSIDGLWARCATCSSNIVLEQLEEHSKKCDTASSGGSSRRSSLAPPTPSSASKRHSAPPRSILDEQDELAPSQTPLDETAAARACPPSMASPAPAKAAHVRDPIASASTNGAKPRAGRSQSAQATLPRKRAVLGDVEKDNAVLVRQIKRLKRRNQELERLRDELGEAATSNAPMLFVAGQHEMVAALHRQVEALNARASAAEAAEARARNQLAAIEEQARERVRAAEDAADARVAEVRRELAETSTENLATVQAQLETHSAVDSELRVQLSEARTNVERLEETVKLHEDRVSAQGTQLITMFKQVSELNDTNHQLRSELADAEHDIASLMEVAQRHTPGRSGHQHSLISSVAIEARLRSWSGTSLGSADLEDINADLVRSESLKIRSRSNSFTTRSVSRPGSMSPPSESSSTPLRKTSLLSRIRRIGSFRGSDQHKAASAAASNSTSTAPSKVTATSPVSSLTCDHHQSSGVPRSLSSPVHTLPSQLITDSPPPHLSPIRSPLSTTTTTSTSNAVEIPSATDEGEAEASDKITDIPPSTSPSNRRLAPPTTPGNSTTTGTGTSLTVARRRSSTSSITLRRSHSDQFRRSPSTRSATGSSANTVTQERPSSPTSPNDGPVINVVDLEPDVPSDDEEDELLREAQSRRGSIFDVVSRNLSSLDEDVERRRAAARLVERRRRAIQMNRVSKSYAGEQPDMLQVYALSDLARNAVVLLQAHVRGLIARRNHKLRVRRSLIVRELLETERSYVHTLRTIEKWYIKPLSCHAMQQPGFETVILTVEEIERVFGTIPDILQLHSTLLERLELRLEHWSHYQCIGDLFSELADTHLELYTRYVNSYEMALSIITAHRNNPAYRKFVDDRRDFHRIKEGLGELLITPVQRIPRYVLLLERLIKNTVTSHPDCETLELSLAHMRDITAMIDDRKRAAQEVEVIQSKLVGAEPIVVPLRRFVLEADIMVVKQGQQRQKLRHIFLFNDLLLCTSVRSSSFLFGRQRISANSFPNAPSSGASGHDALLHSGGIQFQQKWRLPISDFNVKEADLTEPHHRALAELIHAALERNLSAATDDLASVEPTIASGASPQPTSTTTTPSTSASSFTSAANTSSSTTTSSSSFLVPVELTRLKSNTSERIVFCMKERSAMDKFLSVIAMLKDEFRDGQARSTQFRNNVIRKKDAHFGRKHRSPDGGRKHQAKADWASIRDYFSSPTNSGGSGSGAVGSPSSNQGVSPRLRRGSSAGAGLNVAGLTAVPPAAVEGAGGGNGGSGGSLGGIAGGPSSTSSVGVTEEIGDGASSSGVGDGESNGAADASDMSIRKAELNEAIEVRMCELRAQILHEEKFLAGVEAMKQAYGEQGKRKSKSKDAMELSKQHTAVSARLQRLRVELASLTGSSESVL